MQKIVFLTIIFSFLLLSCSPLGVDEQPPRRDDDREGEVELPEDLNENLSFSDFLKNCKPDISTPDNVTDIALDIFNLSDKYPPKVFRECLKKKLEDGHTKICDAREKIERRRERASTQSEKSRYDNQLYKLEQIEFKFNQRLYDLAVNFDDQLIKAQGKEPRNDMGRFLQFLREDETEALRDIFDRQSYSECNFYSYDDE